MTKNQQDGIGCGLLAGWLIWDAIVLIFSPENGPIRVNALEWWLLLAFIAIGASIGYSYVQWANGPTRRRGR